MHDRRRVPINRFGRRTKDGSRMPKYLSTAAIEMEFYVWIAFLSLRAFTKLDAVCGEG
jgi:hypothetical protein